jgi:1,4-alpha-glucan branching enzyme
VPGVSPADRRSAGDRGALAIVLHTHMPYVEGFGTWPFGEEWLWEAIVGSYLPLLDVLDGGAPLTVSLTPVLCDQLQAPGWQQRFEVFVDEVRRDTHRQDAAGMRRAGHERLALELDRSWHDYELALRALQRRGGDLVAAFAPHTQWTSAATHAVLPLLATDAGVRLQVQSGIDSHRARFGEGWRGGFWLPECAHDRRLEPQIADAGVHSTCVELTARFGLGAPEHLRPLSGDAGVVLVPIDRATMDLVWSDGGYPADGAYRDYHHHTIHHHTPWSNDGEPYDHARAIARSREHAADFVARTIARLAEAGGGLPGGGLAVCALDTELLGHWWYEGPRWLTAVVRECERQGLELVRLDDALERVEPVRLPVARPESERGRAPSSAGTPTAGTTDVSTQGTGTTDVSTQGTATTGVRMPGTATWGVSTWGAGGDLSTWSGPGVADIAFETRAAELEVIRAGPGAGAAAVRELLALQSSDWAFMVARDLAVPYARERFAHHRAALTQALQRGPEADASALRNLAAHAEVATLLAP